MRYLRVVRADFAKEILSFLPRLVARAILVLEARQVALELLAHQILEEIDNLHSVAELLDEARLMTMILATKKTWISSATERTEILNATTALP